MSHTNCTKEELCLYAITDRTWLQGRTLAEQVREALEGGVTFLQFREKHLEQEALMKEAGEVKILCKEYGVPFIMNDDVELALKLDADGVHVGQKDMEAAKARCRLGADKIIGVSARTVEQALEAERNGADYLGVGAVFPTSSKEDAKKIDRETLKAICEAVQIPVVAIGGINSENVGELAGSGVCGAAVISAVFAKQDIRAAAEKLKGKITEMVNR